MDTADANSKTGAIQMTVDVIGYMSFENTNNQNLEEGKWLKILKNLLTR